MILSATGRSFAAPPCRITSPEKLLSVRRTEPRCRGILRWPCMSRNTKPIPLSRKMIIGRIAQRCWTWPKGGTQRRKRGTPRWRCRTSSSSWRCQTWSRDSTLDMSDMPTRAFPTPRAASRLVKNQVRPRIGDYSSSVAVAGRRNSQLSWQTVYKMSSRTNASLQRLDQIQQPVYQATRWK